MWHGAIVPVDDHAKFLDRQGRVHARVSVDFAKEFGCYLAVPMQRPGVQRVLSAERTFADRKLGERA